MSERRFGYEQCRPQTRQGGRRLTRTARNIRPTAVALSVLVAIVAVGQATYASTGAGALSGSVDDLSTGAPVAGVCVYALPLASNEVGQATGAPFETQTAGDGSYSMTLPVGGRGYAVRFDPTCDGQKTSSFAAQYYSNAEALALASPITVTPVVPTTGIDAHLQPGYSVSGTVSAPDASSGVAGVCVSAEDDQGNVVDTSKTVPDGSYSLGNLAAGGYLFYFDPTCSGSAKSPYATGYYGPAPDVARATPLELSGNVDGVSFALAAGSGISGFVHVPRAPDKSGICVYAIGPGGSAEEVGRTAPNGSFTLANLPAQTFTLRYDPTCERSQLSVFSTATTGPYTVGAGQTVTATAAGLGLPDGSLEIERAGLPGGTVGKKYFQSLKFVGFSTSISDYRWVVHDLPAGLSFGFKETQADPVFAYVSGTPRQSGKYSVRVTVSSASSMPALVLTRSLGLVVHP